MRLLFELASRMSRFSRQASSAGKRKTRAASLQLETLENRDLLTSFSPIQIRHAYGFDRVGFMDSTHPLVPGNGQGQTIAIVDAYDDPNIASDLAKFDA